MTKDKGAIPRAAGYIRVSQERAVKNGYSLGAQEQEVRRFIEYKDWTLFNVYCEQGVSGYLRTRPAMDQLLADAKAGRFNVAIFPSIDRAGRSVRNVIEIDHALRAAGLDTVYLREGVDTSTPMGELFRNIMASLAEFEGRVIQERLAKGKHRKRSEGGYIGGVLPYGYRKDEHNAVVVAQEEARVVERVFNWGAEQRTIRWIAWHLSAQGAPTRNGGMWQPSTVRGILRNPFYSGCIRFEGRLIPGKHEAIVSETLFRKCNHT